MKFMKIDKNGKILGYFDPEIHDLEKIKDDETELIEIDESKWQEAIKNNYGYFKNNEFLKEEPQIIEDEFYTPFEMIKVLYLKDISPEYQEKYEKIKEWLINQENISDDSTDNKVIDKLKSVF